MTMTNPIQQNDNKLFMDFTEADPEIRPTFRIDNDMFECAARLPAGIAKKLAQIARAPELEQVELVGDIFDIILMPASAARLVERMSDPEHPVTAKQLGRIVNWMMEVFGERPTQPSSVSLPSPTIGGTSSTDGVPPGTSIPTGT